MGLSKSKIIATLVVFILSAVMLSGSAWGGYLLLKRLYLLVTHEPVVANIILCERVITRGAKKKHRKAKYRPVAKAEGGPIVKGRVLGSYERCTESRGSEVSVLVLRSDRYGGYILTFVQSWMMPLALLGGPALAFFLLMRPIIAAMRESRGKF